jgi:flagellar basal-body rod protein FlgB
MCEGGLSKMKLFTSNSFQRLEQSLNYSSLKQQVISQNIANVDTPKYKAKKVSFKTELAEASMEASRTHRSHIPFRGGTGESPILMETQRTSYNP